MGVYCEHCKTSVRGGLTHFQAHLKDHKHGSPFYCSEGTCGKRCYAVKSSLIRHLLESHSETCLTDDDEANETSSSQTTASSQEMSSSQSSLSAPSRHSSQSSAGEENNVPASTRDSRSEEETMDHQGGEGSSDTEESDSDVDLDLENSAARMILNLRRTGNVTEIAMKKFMQETQKLMEQTAETTRQDVIDKLKSAGVDEETIKKSTGATVIQPFKKLKTCEQQMTYFEKNFNLVQPEPKLIGDRYDERTDKRTGNALPIQVAVKYQYIPAKKTLTAVLNNKVLYDLIHSETESKDGKMRSFLDGSLAKKHPLIKKHPHIIRLVLYIDDFECANPLGSKAGPHKITAVYFLIQNLPAEENSRLRSIHLLAYAYREDLPLDKLVDVLLEPFFEELQSLETETGITILVDKKEFTLRATLIALAADTLGAHEILGLHSSSAAHFCSHCLITKKEIDLDIMTIGEMRSKITHLLHLEEIETKGHLFVQKEYAVKRHSLLFYKSKHTPFPDIFVKDGMHDILKGIAPMELKLTLREHCVTKKFFTVDYFNNALKSFNYGLPDSKNKPSPNISQESLTTSFSYNLRQSAAQTWCLLRVFPFIAGTKVPHDDPHFKLIVLLKRLSEIIFSTAVSESDLENLGQLLKEHHELFAALYPPPERANQDYEEELTDDVDEDFLLEEEERETEQEATQATSSASKPAGKKKTRVVRPLNKHHHLLHYVESMQKTGPAVLYWCMRFEGKHAIAKRYAGICGNFRNLPVTMAKIHQINHTADLLDVVAVKDQISSSKKSIVCVAGETDHFEALHAKGVHATDVLAKVEKVTAGGYTYCAGFYVVLPMSINGLPLFGFIKCIYLQKDNVLLVTEDCYVSEYNTRVGAYCIQEENYEHTIRVFSPSVLPHKPLMAWKMNNVAFLSPRCNLLDTIFDANDEED